MGTRRRQDGGRRVAVLLAICASLAGVPAARPARAQDAAAPPRAAEPAGESVRLDLDAFRAPPAPRAANGLWLPTDEGYTGSWTQAYAGEAPEEGPAVQTFQEPWSPAHALAPDVVEDLLRRLVPEAARGAWASRATAEGIEVWTTAAGRERVVRALDFVRAAFAPRLAVRADLVATEGGRDATQASGAARLLPRRWTTLLRRRDATPRVVGFATEVAQEAIVAKPLVASLPTGEEVYARWTPGETASVLEVFVGQLDAREALEVDLSPLRLTPEAVGPAKATLPRTAVRRARTAILLPAGKPTEVEVAWASADGPRRLRLSAEAPSPSPEDIALEKGRVGVVRAGAATTALEDAPRETGPEAAVRSFMSSGASDVALEPFAQAFVLATGDPVAIERLRASVRRAEATLVGATVEVLAVEVPPDAGWARDAAVGRALPDAAAAALGQAPVLWSVRVPVLAGVPASVRAGSSVVGFGDVDASVAQGAAGVSPLPGAWFDGAALTATLTVPPEAGGGARLRLAGTWSWADAKASTAELVFRLPIPLSPVSVPAAASDDMPARRVTVPLAGHGAQSLDADLLLSAQERAASAPLVVATVRSWHAGGRAFPALVLARVRP